MNISPEMKLVSEITALYKDILHDNLVGVYVHGSMAFGCFHWKRSDIDLIVVTESEPPLEQKKALVQVLLDLTPAAPPKGFEMSVVLAQDCRQFQYPVPFVLHFSNAHLAHCQNNLTEYCLTMHGTDPDLAAHFTVLHAVGFPVCGPAISTVFAPVPAAAYWDSLWYDTQEAADSILQDPVYVILNLCRVLAYVKEGLILSKEQGGQWGLAHLPSGHADLVQHALLVYTKGETACFPAERTIPFAHALLKEIRELHAGDFEEQTSFSSDIH